MEIFCALKVSKYFVLIVTSLLQTPKFMGTVKRSDISYLAGSDYIQL